MDKIWIIAKRELESFFDSLTAYIILVAFLGFSGFFTWLYGSDIFLRNQADLRVFFNIAYWTLFFFIPAITMRTFAEENKSGTIELLLTKAVTDWQVVFGKFLACLILILIALGLTLPYYLTVWKLGPIDHGAVLTGYLGLILMSATYISIGIYTSSITNNQIVAFLSALLIGVFFHVIFDVLSQNIPGVVGGFFSYLSVSTHYDSISRGVIDSKDLVYFASIIFLGLGPSELTLAKRNIADQKTKQLNMKNKTSLLKFILPVIGIIILVNILSDSFFFRLDFSADKRYTLSKATKDILANVKSPITVKAYFSENLPPDIAKTKRDFKDLLIEYASRSKGKLVYTFINPGEKEEIEQQATQAGVQPVMINVRDKDQIKQQKAYLGAVVQMGEKTEVIPFMQPGAAMEYALSSCIKKLSIDEKPVVGMLQGHGEATAQAMQQAWNGLTMLYDVQEVHLSESAGVPEKVKTLLIVDPKDSFPATDLQRLDEFLAKGKNIFIAYNRETADLSKATGSSRHTGLEDWLAQKQIQIADKFVVDANCGSVSVLQQQGQFQFNLQVRFPYFPIINKFEDHPVTKGLEQVLLRFPSPISYTGDSAIRYTPLLKSSEKSGEEAPPTFFNVQRQWTPMDFRMSNIVIGAAFSGKISGGANSKMVVIANGDFAVNGEGQNAIKQLPPDNINLFVNAVDWLSDESGLVELRTKGVTSRPLNTIEDSTKIFYKYLNFLLPMLLVIAFGFIRAQMKRNQRVRRMEEDYS